MEDVRDVMEFAATSVRHHNESLGNYEEVKKVLFGSKFEGLLH